MRTPDKPYYSKLELPHVQTIPRLEQFKTVPLLAPSPITWKNLSGSKFSKPLKILRTSIRSARRNLVSRVRSPRILKHRYSTLKLKKYCILRRRFIWSLEVYSPNIGKIALIGRYNWKTSEWEILEIEYCSFDNFPWVTIKSHNFWWLIKIFRNPDRGTFTHVPPFWVRAW